MFALRGNQYQFIGYRGVWDTDELYDLKNDPEERKNLIGFDSAEVKQVIAQLHAKLLAKMREIDDPALP